MASVKILLDMFIALIALIATTSLSLFGVSLSSSRDTDREIHRVSDCAPVPLKAPEAIVANPHC